MKKRNDIPKHARMVFKGVLFEVWQWEQELFDGSTQTFERLKRPNTVQVIAAVGDKILIQDEQQPDAPRAFPSIPGGRADENEMPLHAAQRELMEESGYSSDDWELWREDNPVGKLQWTIYTFIARRCSKTGEPHMDAGERITSRLVSFDEFLDLSNNPDFYSPEIVSELLRMRLDPAKKEEFRRNIFG